MRRLVMAASVLVIFGLGMLAGGMVLRPAHAQRPVVTEVSPSSTMGKPDAAPVCRCPGCAYALRNDSVLAQLDGWQIISVPAPDNAQKQLTLLVRMDSADTYRLKVRNGFLDDYVWSRVERQ